MTSEDKAAVVAFAYGVMFGVLATLLVLVLTGDKP